MSLANDTLLPGEFNRHTLPAFRCRSSHSEPQLMACGRWWRYRRSRFSLRLQRQRESGIVQQHACQLVFPSCRIRYRFTCL